MAALLVNDRARRAATGGWRLAVRDRLAHRFHLEFLFPRSSDESAELARESAAHGAEVVVAAGGDGTINSVASGLAGTDVPLGILPLGTANDLARELGIPRDLEGAARRIAEGTARRMDLGEVNGRVFCTVGGITLTAQTALMVSRLKGASPIARRVADVCGGGIYRVASAVNLLARRHISQHATVAYTTPEGTDHELSLEAHTVFVANNRTLGGGLVLPTGSRADDGVLEIAMVPRRSRPSLLMNFTRLAAGRPLAAGVLETVHAVRATIRTEHDDDFVADGDLLASGREFRLGVRRGALGIVA